MRILLLLAALVAGAAGATPDDGARRLDEAWIAIDKAIALSSAPGLVVGITDRSMLRKVAIHGYADLKTRRPLTADSLFAIGSISKSFTAVALMELRDENRFHPEDRIDQYLPWFAVESSFAPMTGQHLLTHTAGLPKYLPDLSSSRYTAYALRNFKPRYAPGEHFWYSNTGYQVLGYVLESVEQQPYHSIIQRRILAPLGMRASYAMIDDSLRSKLVMSYVRSATDGEYVEAPWFEYSAADGSIASTVADMSAYARLLLNAGKAGGKPLLSDESFKMLTTPLLSDYAYGLEVRHEQGGSVIRHSGSMAGFTSLVETHPSDGYGVVILSNGNREAALWRWIVDTVGAAYRGETIKPFQPKPVNSISMKKFAGQYRAIDGSTLNFASNSGSLSVVTCDASGTAAAAGGAECVHKRAVVLSPLGVDAFRTPVEDSNRLPYIFSRDGKDMGGPITQVSHGADWYVNTRHGGDSRVAAPPEYSTYVGHYENHNAEGPSVRVFVRQGRLVALEEGEVSEGGAVELDQVGPGVFRPTKPDYNPESVQFDTVVEGQALRMIMTGTPLYRMDTQ
jgi:D-alanyl-D-alanine carboxypeptidase